MAEEKAAEKAEAQEAPLGSAAASIDPRVHQLIAERAIMVSAEADGEDAKAALRVIDQKLAGLGVSVDQ